MKGLVQEVDGAFSHEEGLPCSVRGLPLNGETEALALIAAEWSEAAAEVWLELTILDELVQEVPGRAF